MRMRGTIPDLREQQDYITKVIRTEEENFAKTIDGGMKIFSELLAEHKAKGETQFSGSDAFKLYDTYGFPVDLTDGDGPASEGMTLDRAGFDQELMEEQRVRARKAREALGDLGWAGVEFGKEVPATEFDGYAQTTLTEAKVLAIVAEDEPWRMRSCPGWRPLWCWTSTTFYAEMGGQVADHGTLAKSGPEGGLFQVTDVQKNKGGKYMHYGKLTQGSLKVGDAVTAAMDPVRRGGHYAGPHRHPSAGQGPAHRAGGPCPPGRLPGGARPAAL